MNKLKDILGWLLILVPSILVIVLLIAIVLLTKTGEVILWLFGLHKHMFGNLKVFPKLSFLPKLQ